MSPHSSPISSYPAFEAVLEMLVEIATNDRVVVRGIESRLGLNPRYLEAHAWQLKQVDILKGRRGRKGYTAFARPISEITLGDVWRSVRIQDDHSRRKSGIRPSTRTPMQLTVRAEIERIESRMLAELDAVTVAEFVKAVVSQNSRVQSSACPMIAAL